MHATVVRGKTSVKICFVEDKVRLDSFLDWDRRLAYFNVKVFDHFASTCALPLKLSVTILHSLIKGKNMIYKRICEVDRGILLIFFV